jgi:hypothetical protein
MEKQGQNSGTGIRYRYCIYFLFPRLIIFSLYQLDYEVPYLDSNLDSQKGGKNKFGFE